VKKTSQRFRSDEHAILVKEGAERNAHVKSDQETAQVSRGMSWRCLNCRRRFLRFVCVKLFAGRQGKSEADE
jgi:hypothetical protein